jgi:flagellar biosynthesis/type III secretory pathway M-ring protein FliF/YscJ
MVNILRGYVPNLAKDQISIVDVQGRNYNSFKTDEDADADDYIEEVDRINKSISKRIETYLDSVLGHDRYKVSVSAKISREKIETQATRYSGGAVGSRQTAKEEMNSSGTNTGKNYKQNNKTETMYPNFEQQNVTYLPGRVTDVTVALAVDKSVPATMSLKQLQESIAAIVGPNIAVDNIKMTVVDLYTAEDQVMEAQKPKGFWTILTQGGTWGIVGKILAGIGILFVLLIAAVIGLNIIGAAGRSNTDLETDPNLNKEYEDLFPTTADEAYAYDDFGEQQAIAQQEALLKEMSKPAPETSNVSGQQIEFDSLLNGLQSTAKAQPDALARKIQVWLDED